MPQESNGEVINSQKIKKIIKKTWRRIMFVIFAGIILTLIISLHSPKSNNCSSFIQTLYTFGCGLLIGGASFAAGGLGGFIFGIPSMTQNKEDPSIALRYNDNLIQISDWLTKIIVGVGLIELNKIPGKISDLGESLKASFGNEAWGKNASLAIVFYFLLFGFLIVYFWTRTDFTKILKETDEQVRPDIEKLRQNVKVLMDSEDAQKSKKLVDQSPNALLDLEVANTKKLIEQSADVTDKFVFESLDTEDSTALKAALDQLREKVKQVLKNKPIRVKDDLQKNRWGGKAENNGKKIEATVTQSDGSSFYDILIAISDKSKALDVPVAIFVHDSYEFPDNVIYVKPDSNGVAQVTLSAYEAFTVGALFADGTELELDLNEQQGYPEGFYWRKNNANSLA